MKFGSHLLWILTLTGLNCGGCVTPPTPREILETGFRTPELTFRTLQVAVRGDLPGLEYRCLSIDFRARGFGGVSLSQLAYREFREQVLCKRLEFWVGIPDAVIIENRPLGEGRCLLRAVSHGYEFEFEMVREDFWQAWAGAQQLADEALAHGTFHRWAEIYREGTGPPRLGVMVSLSSDLAARDLQELNSELTEFRIGREWKIDRIVGLDDGLDS